MYDVGGKKEINWTEVRREKIRKTLAKVRDVRNFFCREAFQQNMRFFHINPTSLYSFLYEMWSEKKKEEKLDKRNTIIVYHCEKKENWHIVFD